LAQNRRPIPKRKVRGPNPPDDIRHRMLKWNRERELWEPCQLAEERELPRFLEDTKAYTGKSGASNRILRGVPLRALAKDKETRDMRETEHGHKGPYLPLIFEACGEDQYAYEYRRRRHRVWRVYLFHYENAFDLGHEHAGTRRKWKFTFQDLVISVAEVMKPYYNQQPQLVGQKPGAKPRCHGPRRGPGLAVPESPDSSRLAGRRDLRYLKRSAGASLAETRLQWLSELNRLLRPQPIY
jgi:metacaspase-1